MMRSARYLVLIIALALAAVGGSALYHRASERDAVDSARTWARLAPLPASASDVEVRTIGSAFSREFVVRFHAPASAIDAWLASSPGTASTGPVVDGAVRTYGITPGGGAQFAEVRFDDATHVVTIRTYWS